LRRFSIRREVISSDSALTLSTRCGAESSRSTLRQLGVDQLGEQGLLALLDDARALRHVDQRRLDDDRQVLLLQLVLDLEHFVALADRLGAEARVLGPLDPLDPARAQRLDRGAERIGDPQPGKAQRQRRAGDEHGDPEDARSGKAEQVLARAAEDEAEHAACVAARDLGFPLVQAGPFERGAGREQHRQPQPHRPRRQHMGRRLCRRPAVRAKRSGQRAEPRAGTDDDRPPDRIAGEEEADVGEPGAEDAGAVVDRTAAARGREPRIGRAVGSERKQCDQPDDGADQERGLLAPVRRVASGRVARPQRFGTVAAE
jgi:hypothetical protein